MILLTFRKAVLPIEVESNDDSADYTDSHQYEGGDGEETEQICAKMKKTKKQLMVKQFITFGGLSTTCEASKNVPKSPEIRQKITSA